MERVTIIKPSALFLLIRLLATLFVLESLYGLCFVAYVLIEGMSSFGSTFIYFLWVLQVIKFVFTFLILSDIGTRYLNSRYYIADHHILSEKGLVGNEEAVYELSSLRKVIVDQDWLGKKLDYGTLKLVLGARGYSEELKLHYIATPRRIKEILDARLGAYQPSVP